jgi:glycosyltransferase involved in cell wall biosynthesis
MNEAEKAADQRVLDRMALLGSSKTPLRAANAAFREKNFEQAVGLYARALLDSPWLSTSVLSNLSLSRQRYRQSRQGLDRPKVLVSCWNLAGNAAGRAFTLADIYRGFADSEIIGCYLPGRGSELWAPLKDMEIPVNSLTVDESRVVEQLINFVSQNPCDVLHLAKPRLPNILTGLIYKLVWGCPVLVDVDDDELAFVSSSEVQKVDSFDLFQKNGDLPPLRDLAGLSWTQLAVGFVPSFDGVTVANGALKGRYGGTVIPHARDEALFRRSPQMRHSSRVKLKIPTEHKVVIFLGTPREHKGLAETAETLARLGRKDVTFLVVGEFPKRLLPLRQRIQATQGLNTIFLGDQSFKAIPDLLAAADVCVLLQDPDSPAARFQTPAKLTDALAMGLVVLAQSTPGMEDLYHDGAFIRINHKTLDNELKRAFDREVVEHSPHKVFLEKLSLSAVRPELKHALEGAESAELGRDLSLLAKRIGLDSFISLDSKGRRSLLGPQSPTDPSPAQLPPLTAPPSEYINAASQAMAMDDWSGAYQCWKALYDRLGKQLDLPTLLRISREQFKLDAFSEAAKALEQAARLGPEHPAVLCEQAQQYYYHCYSSWLMLVTENEPEWYKADGLETRPDWKTACQLIEKAEKAAPRNNLRRYVQAYLLLAEEAWDNQNRKEAHAALGIALKAIGPNKIDAKLIQAIHTAVKQVRDDQVIENDPYFQTLQDQIKALPLELLSVLDWLCLNDILNWNGLLLCGYVAREKAVDLALSQGRANGASKETLKTAVKAALDRNQNNLAEEFLVRLKQITRDAIDVQELDSCCELKRGNLNSFRQKWPHPPSAAELRFRRYLTGKSVAVVGPAPARAMDGEEIDTYDLVVRMNWWSPNKTQNSKIYGSRTDLSLYNAHTIRLLTKRGQLHQLEESFDFVLTRKPSFRVSNGSARKINDNPSVFYKSLNALPSIVFDALLCGAKNVKLFHATFYMGITHHDISYRQKVGKAPLLPLRNYQPIMANHCLLAQIKQCNYLKETTLLDNSMSVRCAMDLECADYITWIESLTRRRKSSNAEVQAAVLEETKLTTESALSWIDCDIEELQKYDRRISLKTPKIPGVMFLSLLDFKKFIENKSISLVANSSDLLKRANGSIIDSSDIVIRFNAYKIDTRFTGEKMTVHAGVYLHNHNIGVKVPIRCVISISEDRWIQAVKDKPLGYQQGGLLRFSHVIGLPTYRKLGIKGPPTTGFVTLLLLLALGGYREILLHGFTFYENGKRSIYRDNDIVGELKSEIADIHDYKFEKEFIAGTSTFYDKKNNIYGFESSYLSRKLG